MLCEEKLVLGNAQWKGDRTKAIVAGQVRIE